MNQRPWPVVLLSALGAWLAAIPFFAVAVLLLEPMLRERDGALIMGLLMLGGAIALLRANHRSLFIENLGVPTLLAGLALFGWGLSEPLSGRHLCGVLGLLSVALAFTVPQSWVRALLGAIAPQFLLMALSPEAWWRGDRSWLSPWVSLHGLAALWLGSVALRLKWPATTPPSSHALEQTGNGWIASTLFALAWWSGSTFLLSEPMKLNGVHAAHGINAAWTLKGIDLGSLTAALLASLEIGPGGQAPRSSGASR